jgi:hypothetical protein
MRSNNSLEGDACKATRASGWPLGLMNWHMWIGAGLALAGSALIVGALGEIRKAAATPLAFYGWDSNRVQR